jgi:asparagine N-glycosylation enzyme membrane subunit Stt3
VWRIVSTFHTGWPTFGSYLAHDAFEPLLMVIVLLLIEWVQRQKQHGLDLKSVRWAPVRYAIYYGLIFIIYQYGAEQQDFIYFQF